jgi:hypothetical protein
MVAVVMDDEMIVTSELAHHLSPVGMVDAAEMGIE